MKQLSKYLIVDLILISLIMCQEKLEKYKTCAFRSPDSTITYNLDMLRNSVADYTINANTRRFTYKANFCGPMVETCNGSYLSAALFSSSHCFGKLTSDWEFSSVEYADPQAKGNGIKLNFVSGDKCYIEHNSNYQVSYSIKCNPNILGGELKAVNQLMNCNYEFVFESQYGCAIIAEGTSITILFNLVLVIICYLILFTYMKYKENPEDGILKALPHKEFWLNFFSNSYLGFQITLNFISYVLGRLISKDKANERYQEI